MASDPDKRGKGPPDREPKVTGRAGRGPGRRGDKAGKSPGGKHPATGFGGKGGSAGKGPKKH